MWQLRGEAYAFHIISIPPYLNTIGYSILSCTNFALNTIVSECHCSVPVSPCQKNWSLMCYRSKNKILIWSTRLSIQATFLLNRNSEISIPETRSASHFSILKIGFWLPTAYAYDILMLIKLAYLLFIIDSYGGSKDQFCKRT